LKFLEVVVDVDRCRVVGLLRVLPSRQSVREDGRLDVSAAMRLAMKRVDLLGPADPGDAATQIARLEADADYFWWPTDELLRTVGAALLKRPPTSLQLVDLRAAVVRPGAPSPDTAGDTASEREPPSVRLACSTPERFSSRACRHVSADRWWSSTTASRALGLGARQGNAAIRVADPRMRYRDWTGAGVSSMQASASRSGRVPRAMSSSLTNAGWP
jgi:hypothetical protein